MEIVDGFLYSAHTAAEIGSFEASGNRNQALQILATNFGFTRSLGNGGKCTERSRLAGAADEQRVIHSLERRAIFLRKADADGVRAAVAHNGRRGGRAFEDGECVGADLVGSKTCTGS